MGDGIYSRGKQLLEEEKQKPVPPAIVTETLDQKDLTEKAKAVQDILLTIQPLVDAKLQQNTQIVSLRKAVSDFNGGMVDMNVKLEILTHKINELVDSLGENAEIEHTVLKQIQSKLLIM